MSRSAILSIRIVSNSTDAKAGLDRTSRSLDKLGQSAARESVSVQRMNQQFDRMSTAALKVGAVGTAALSATSRIAGLAQAMAPLAGFAVLLPGALSAGAVGLATFKVATAGLGDAFKAAGKGVEEFDQATKDMAPAMRDSVREMVKVNAQFAPTKRAVQEAFWSGMAGSVRQIAAAYLPQVNKGMIGLASSTNRLVRGLALGAEQGAKFGAVEASFKAVQRVVDSVTPAMTPLARGMLQLVQASADLIPGFKGAEQYGARFEAWAQRVSGDGTLQRWLNGAVDAAKSLGGVLEGAGRILSGVFKAAADANGGNVMKSLADNLRKVGDAINRPEIQAKLSQAFRRANDVVKKAVDLFVKLLPYIVDMAPYVMALAGAWKVFSAAAAIFKAIGLVSEMGGLAGALKMVAGGPIGWIVLAVIAIGAAFVVAYNKSETFRKVVDTAAKVAKEKLEQLWQWLQDTFGPIWDVIRDKAAEWGPILAQKAQEAWTKIQELWGWLVETFTPVWEQLKTTASTWASVASEAAQWLWQKLQEIWGWVQENLIPIWDRVKGPLLSMIGAGVQGFARMLIGAMQIADWLWKHLGPAFSALSPLASFVGNAIYNQFTAGARAVKAVVDIVFWLKDAFDRAQGAASSIGGAISGAMSGAIGWIRAAIGWADSLRRALSNMPGPAGGLFSLFGSGGMWVRPAVPSTLPEVGMPFYMTAAGLSFPSAPMSPGTFQAGNTYVYNIQVESLDPAQSGRQIRQVLQRDARRDGAITAGGKLW